MDKEKFDALLPLIITSLMQKIIELKNVSHDEAFTYLYSSQLYIALDDEETKVWHYSADKLYQLLDDEMITGQLVLPEY